MQNVARSSSTLTQEHSEMLIRKNTLDQRWENLQARVRKQLSYDGMKLEFNTVAGGKFRQVNIDFVFNSECFHEVINYRTSKPPSYKAVVSTIEERIQQATHSNSLMVRRLTNKVYPIDCIEFMRNIPDGSIQLVFADPPFNVNKKYLSYDDKLSSEEYWSWTSTWLHECVRILRDDGSLFLYNIPRHLIHSVAILNEIAMFRHWIAWDSVGKPLGPTLQPSHYGILFYSKTDNVKYYDVRAPHKVCRHCHGYLKDYGGKEHLRHKFGTLVSDVWNDLHRNRHASKRIDNHPCQLPVHLLERILLIGSDSGDVVFDPFCGGGSMAVAARQLKRRYIGTEIDPHYAEVSQQKYDEAKETKVKDNVYASIHLGKVVTIRDIDIEKFH